MRLAQSVRNARRKKLRHQMIRAAEKYTKYTIGSDKSFITQAMAAFMYKKWMSAN
jgi:hypothetical protein